MIHIWHYSSTINSFNCSIHHTKTSNWNYRLSFCIYVQTVVFSVSLRGLELFLVAPLCTALIDHQYNTTQCEIYRMLMSYFSTLTAALQFQLCLSVMQISLLSTPYDPSTSHVILWSMLSDVFGKSTKQLQIFLFCCLAFSAMNHNARVCCILLLSFSLPGHLMQCVQIKRYQSCSLLPSHTHLLQLSDEVVTFCCCYASSCIPLSFYTLRDNARFDWTGPQTISLCLLLLPFWLQCVLFYIIFGIFWFITLNFQQCLFCDRWSAAVSPV